MRRTRVPVEERQWAQPQPQKVRRQQQAQWAQQRQEQVLWWPRGQQHLLSWILPQLLAHHHNQIYQEASARGMPIFCFKIQAVIHCTKKLHKNRHSPSSIILLSCDVQFHLPTCLLGTLSHRQFLHKCHSEKTLLKMVFLPILNTVFPFFPPSIFYIITNLAEERFYKNIFLDKKLHT